MSTGRASECQPGHDAEDLDWEEWDPTKTTFVQHMIAGSVAGLAEHTCMFPVDTLKTHIQCERCGSANPVNTLRCAKRIIRREGVMRLWRGVTTMFAGCVPAHAAYFSLYEAVKLATNADAAGHHPVQAAAAGAVATFAHDIVMTPVDVVKQRLQLGYYRGIFDCVKTVYKVEGTRGFFLSLPTTLVMNLPYGGVMVATNESVKKIVNPSGEFNLLAYMFSGTVAGVVAAAVTTPLDLIKTRLQTQGVSAAEAVAGAAGASATGPVPHACPKSVFNNLPMGVVRSKQTFAREADAPRYRGFFQAFRQIVVDEGPRGLFRGMMPRMLMHGPSVAISWSAYETIKALLTK